ncbi:MAG TPA: hypothetical protein VEB18_04315 [Candidatus Paceibacterota bacterium]|nr:hypothetical protein [Candidatus Paceibacterota bacterium]
MCTALDLPRCHSCGNPVTYVYYLANERGKTPERFCTLACLEGFVRRWLPDFIPHCMYTRSDSSRRTISFSVVSIKHRDRLPMYVDRV